MGRFLRPSQALDSPSVVKACHKDHSLPRHQSIKANFMESDLIYPKTSGIIRIDPQIISGRCFDCNSTK